MDRVIWGQRVPEITGGLVGLLDVFVQRVPLVNCFSGVSRGSVTILIVLFFVREDPLRTTWPYVITIGKTEFFKYL